MYLGAMEKTAFSPEDLLRAHGMRVTPVRCQVVALLHRLAGAKTHQQVLDEFGAEGLEMDRVTVYRTLNSLTEAGILHRITGVDRTFSYALHAAPHLPQAHSDDHPHFVCEQCSLTFCLPEVPIEVSEIRAPKGFTCHHTEVKVFGLCPDCS